MFYLVKVFYLSKDNTKAGNEVSDKSVLVEKMLPITVFQIIMIYFKSSNIL